MRGKKSDPEFISQFISKCLQQGIVITEDMVNRAKQDIQEIDNKIIEVEKLKVVRSKLLDVVLALDKLEVKTEEAKLLPLFKLQYPQTCKQICDNISHKNPDDDYCILGVKDPEVLFCLKQLLEAKVIARTPGTHNVVQGERFQDYMEFIFREVKC